MSSSAYFMDEAAIYMSEIERDHAREELERSQARERELEQRLARLETVLTQVARIGDLVKEPTPVAAPLPVQPVLLTQPTAPLAPAPQLEVLVPQAAPVP